MADLDADVGLPPTFDPATSATTVSFGLRGDRGDTGTGEAFPPPPPAAEPDGGRSDGAVGRAGGDLLGGRMAEAAEDERARSLEGEVEKVDDIAEIAERAMGGLRDLGEDGEWGTRRAVLGVGLAAETVRVGFCRRREREVGLGGGGRVGGWEMREEGKEREKVWEAGSSSACFTSSSLWWWLSGGGEEEVEEAEEERNRRGGRVSSASMLSTTSCCSTLRSEALDSTDSCRLCSAEVPTAAWPSLSAALRGCATAWGAAAELRVRSLCRW